MELNELRDGQAVKIHGIPAKVKAGAPVDGVVCELIGPGGWGRWAVTAAGNIATITSVTRGRKVETRVVLTGWTLADVTAVEAAPAKGAPVIGEFHARPRVMD